MLKSFYGSLFTLAPGRIIRAYANRRLDANHVRSLALLYEDETFFNRKKEIHDCLEMLKTPSITVITGPPNGGKSALLNEVLRQVEHDRPILHVDMRAHPFTDPLSFFLTMEKKLSHWSSSIAEFAAKFVSAVDTPYFNLDLNKIYPEPGLSPSHKIECLFNSLLTSLPEHSFWTGQKYPILFIDEANLMSNLTHTKEGKIVLMQLLTFLVKCTKQDRRFPVLLASSDSFYHMWLANLIGEETFETYVVGHLPKEEAKRYWEQHVLTRKEMAFHEPPTFEDAYAICGGSMFLLSKYYTACYLNGGTLPPEDFWYVRRAIARLMKGLRSKSWKKDQWMKVMTRMTENGFHIPYEELVNEMTEEVVDSMIRENILHLRPTGFLEFDPEKVQVRREALTPTSPVAAMAMKLIVQNEQ